MTEQQQLQSSHFIPKTRVNSSYSLSLNRQVLSKFKSKHKPNNSLDQDQLKSSYSVVKLQMEDDGKVSVQTNRRLLRIFSAAKVNDLLKPEFINPSQFFYYTPIKTPSPLHQLTLQKQRKTVIVRMPDKKTNTKKSGISDLIKQKIQLAQRKNSTSNLIKPTKINLEPRVSYSKIFQQIQENPNKYQEKANQYSIMFNDQAVKKIHSIRESQLVQNFKQF